jgi:hypothetical protein
VSQRRFSDVPASAELLVRLAFFSASSFRDAIRVRAAGDAAVARRAAVKTNLLGRIERMARVRGSTASRAPVASSSQRQPAATSTVAMRSPGTSVRAPHATDERDVEPEIAASVVVTSDDVRQWIRCEPRGPDSALLTARLTAPSGLRIDCQVVHFICLIRNAKVVRNGILPMRPGLA